MVIVQRVGVQTRAIHSGGQRAGSWVQTRTIHSGDQRAGVQTRAVHWVQQPGWGSGVQTRAVQWGSEGRDHRGPNEGCSQQGPGLPGSKEFTGP